MVTRKWFFLFLVLATGAFLWQSVIISKLKAERQQVRAELAKAEAARANNPDDTTSRTQPQEDKLHAGQAELNRLRAEVSQLRKDIKAAQLASAKRVAEGAATNMPGPPVLEVQTYAANVEATVPFSQTLVTGGWKLPSGKHALFFIEPQPGGADSPEQVLVRTKILELSEETLVAVGLDSLKSDAAETTSQLILDEAQVRTILRALEQREGVDILSAPRVLTLSGRQAQVRIGNSIPTADGTYTETGPSLDVTPVLSADGTFTTLRVSAQMRLQAER